MKPRFKKIIFTSVLSIVLVTVLQTFSTSQPTEAPSIEARKEITNGLTLWECYELALKQSERLAIQQEQIKIAEARFIQSLSGILPRVSFQRTELREKIDNNSQGESRFIFTQPLFSGFREFAAMAGSKAEKRQRKFELLRAKHTLFIDVVDAFYFFASYQRDMNSLLATKQALTERVNELNKRMELGRSRISEVSSAEASLSRVEADIELVISQKEVARELLEFLTGRTIENVQDTENFATALAPLDVYIEKADQRPDVLAAKEAVEVSERQLTIARADFWPSVSVEGNYYDERIGSSSEGEDWDALLSIDVPIFQGGQTVGEVKEATALKNQQELFYEETRRLAVLNIRNIYTQLQSGMRRTAALQKAFEATERNYKLLGEDYLLNLVNNLEVLRSLEDTYIAQRNFISVESETKRLFWALKVATGDIAHDSF